MPHLAPKSTIFIEGMEPRVMNFVLDTLGIYSGNLLFKTTLLPVQPGTRNQWGAFLKESQASFVLSVPVPRMKR